MDHAPYFTDVAAGPTPQAYWVRASDGVRNRIAVFSGGSRGTVLLFTGRTEYAEKYGQVAGDFVERDLSILVVDWRGQGLSDRVAPDKRMGHVAHFLDYQRDVEAVVKAAKELELPKPWYLLGHSMGGAIGLRALYQGLDVTAASFTGPMWDIAMKPILRPVAFGLGYVANVLGLTTMFAPGTGPTNYVLSAPFNDNLLTTDEPSYQALRRQMETHPELSIGGPSVGWVSQALHEAQDLKNRPAPTLPAITFLGTNERIVDKPAVESRMAGWTNGELVKVEGGEHELLMEGDTIRLQVIDQMLSFFGVEAGQPGDEEQPRRASI